MKIRKPSFSAIDTFGRCPRQYAEGIIRGRGPESKAMLRGTHLHACLEEAAKHKLDHDCTWREAIDAILEAPPDGILSQPVLEDHLERVFPIVSQLEPSLGGVELWFDVVGPAADLPELPICGKIDLISEVALKVSEQARPYASEEDPCLVDYKAISNERRIKASYEARRSMQFKIYALATGIRRAGFVYLTPKDECRAMFVELTEDDLRIAYRYLTMQLESMLSCWERFLWPVRPRGSGPLTWGMEVDDIENDLEYANWSAWNLSHPDNFLCSSKWCDFHEHCIGKK